MYTKQISITLALGVGMACFGQAPPAPEKPDSPEVKALIEKAKKTGGSMWAEEEQFFCEAPRANNANDPPIAPTKIFDNVYAIGSVTRSMLDAIDRAETHARFATRAVIRDDDSKLLWLLLFTRDLRGRFRNDHRCIRFFRIVCHDTFIVPRTVGAVYDRARCPGTETPIVSTSRVC